MKVNPKVLDMMSANEDWYEYTSGGRKIYMQCGSNCTHKTPPATLEVKGTNYRLSGKVDVENGEVVNA